MRGILHIPVPARILPARILPARIKAVFTTRMPVSLTTAVPAGFIPTADVLKLPARATLSAAFLPLRVLPARVPAFVIFALRIPASVRSFMARVRATVFPARFVTARPLSARAFSIRIPATVFPARSVTTRPLSMTAACPVPPLPVRILTFLAALCLSLWLAGCSSSTTVSEWSCPTDQPDGCFTVAEGDAMALEALRGAGNAGAGVTVRRTVVPAEGEPSPASLPAPISTGGEPDMLYDADGWPVKPNGARTSAFASPDGDAARRAAGRRDRGTGFGERTASGRGGDGHVHAGGGGSGNGHVHTGGGSSRGRGDSPLGPVRGDGDMSPPDRISPDHVSPDQGPVDPTRFAERARTGTANTPHADAPAPITSGPITPGPITPGPITPGRIVGAFADTPPPGFVSSSSTVSGPGAVRVPETLAEIWIGPFEDAAGNWHPVGRMFIIVSPARWRRP